MADNIREGGPEKARKKKVPPPDDEDRPRKKPPADDDEADEAPRKKKKVARDDDDGHDLGSSPLSAIIPVGGSIFGLLSLWLSVIAGLLAFAGVVLFYGQVISVIMPSLWPISLACGGLAFVTHKHKASYGSIAGNLRAIIGILISLVVMLAHGVLIFMFATGK